MGFIPRSLVLRSFVYSWILKYRNWPILKLACCLKTPWYRISVKAERSKLWTSVLAQLCYLFCVFILFPLLASRLIFLLIWLYCRWDSSTRLTPDEVLQHERKGEAWYRKWCERPWTREKRGRNWKRRRVIFTSDKIITFTTALINSFCIQDFMWQKKETEKRRLRFSLFFCFLLFFLNWSQCRETLGFQSILNP